MAVAKRAVKKSTGEDKGVLLHLSNTEAEVLFRITHMIGGDPKNTPRKYVARIYEALKSVSVADESEHYAASGTINFLPYPDPVKAPKKSKEVDPINGPTTATQQFTGCGPSRKPAPAEVQKVFVELGEALDLIPPIGPKVGDRVEMVQHYHGLHEGTQGTLTKVDPDGPEHLYYGKTDDGRSMGGMFAERFKVIPRVPKVGGLVRKIAEDHENPSSFTRGEVAVIEREDGEGFYVHAIDSHERRGYGNYERFELI